MDNKLLTFGDLNIGDTLIFDDNSRLIITNKVHNSVSCIYDETNNTNTHVYYCSNFVNIYNCYNWNGDKSNFKLYQNDINYSYTLIETNSGISVNLPIPHQAIRIGDTVQTGNVFYKITDVSYSSDGTFYTKVKSCDYYNKEFHVYLDSNYPKDTYTSISDTQKAIASNETIINTTQLQLLNFGLLEYGYKLFFHLPVDYNTSGKIVYEVKLGVNEWYPDKELRKSHNISKIINVLFCP